MSEHLKQTDDSFESRMTPKAELGTLARDHSGRQDAPTVLSRYAKAIAAVVEAGGPKPTPFMRAAMFDDDMKPKTVGRIYREPTIAVLEKYVREDVVVWFDGKYETHSDVYRAYQTANMYFASIERVPSGEQVFYTDKPLPHADAMIAFLEAIVEVVAGEKVEVGHE